MTIAREMKGFKAYGSNKKLFIFCLPLFPISCYSWALSLLSTLYATITLMASCKRWKTTCCKQGFLLAITYTRTGLPRHLVLSLQPFCWYRLGLLWAQMENSTRLVAVLASLTSADLIQKPDWDHCSYLIYSTNGCWSSETCTQSIFNNRKDFHPLRG